MRMPTSPYLITAIYFMKLFKNFGLHFINLSVVFQCIVSPILASAANFRCSFQSCRTKNVQLTEGDPPVTLPCDFNTPINSSSTTTGNYTYCYNGTILAPHANSSYTIENIDYTLDNSKICCFDNEAQSCAVCYDFNVYCKYPTPPVCCIRVVVCLQINQGI